MRPQLLITGSGRCGTGYIAEVLTAAGVECGHENWWHPLPGQPQCSNGPAEASWCALGLHIDDDVVVAHQMRHPLDVISSECKRPTDGPYRDLLNSMLPWVPASQVEYAMLAWFTLTERAQLRSAFTYRVDDVDAALVVSLARSAGVTITVGAAVKALRAVPHDVNWHGEGPRYDWVDLPEGGLRDAIMRYARDWGWR